MLCKYTLVAIFFWDNGDNFFFEHLVTKLYEKRLFPRWPYYSPEYIYMGHVLSCAQHVGPVWPISPVLTLLMCGFHLAHLMAYHTRPTFSSLKKKERKNIPDVLPFLKFSLSPSRCERSTPSGPVLPWSLQSCKCLKFVRTWSPQAAFRWFPCDLNKSVTNLSRVHVEIGVW